jgi:hypothetical protein
VPAVVRHGGGRRERQVEPGRSGDADGDLRDLDRVGEAGAGVVVVGCEEDLALACQAAERPAVLDAIEVALEAGSERVGSLGARPIAGIDGTCGQRRELLGLGGLALATRPNSAVVTHRDQVVRGGDRLHEQNPTEPE